MANNQFRDEQDRTVNICQWVCAHFANPENEADLRAVLGLPGAREGHKVLYELTVAAAPYGVKESELGSAIKALAGGF